MNHVERLISATGMVTAGMAHLAIEGTRTIILLIKGIVVRYLFSCWLF